MRRWRSRGNIAATVGDDAAAGALGVFAHGSGRADWQPRALRLLDILMDGLRHKQPTRRPAPE
jgi:hypothetical protein